MSLSADALVLLKVGTDAIPSVFRDDARTLEDLHAMAAMMGDVQGHGRDMLARVRVETASVDTGWTDADGNPVIGPDWLNLLAGDYGTSRQNAETDPTLRTRMRTTQPGVIRRELLGLAQAIVDAAGVVGMVEMVEMPRDAASIGTWASDYGTGGTFAIVSGQMKFTPTPPVRFAYPPFFEGLSGCIASASITFSGSAGNDGTFPVTGLDDDGVLYVNSGGLAGVDSGAAWSTSRVEVGGGVVESHVMAYLDRGYRCWKAPQQGHTICGIIVILPFGCTDSTRRSVQEMLRQHAAGGVIKLVEVRGIP
jgi:hypothetical protein